MKHRNGSSVATHATLLCAFVLAGCGSGGERDRPDVLVVLVDTLRADRLPFYGYPEDTAPFLSSWAARSVVFERAWATSSWTAPATASLFTGVYPDQHGVVVGMVAFEHMQRVAKLELNRLPDELETLPELFRSAGYRTLGLADNPNIGTEIGFDQGFDRFEKFSAEGCERMTAKLQEWSTEIRAARPWFVYLHFMDPHAPYLERAPYYRAPAEENPIAPGSAAYDSEIRYLDREIERAFELLGVGEETLVVFLADHGEEFGDHGGKGHDPQLYSELTHIPLFIRVPGVAPRRERAPVSQIDLLPTLRDFLGAPRTEQDTGWSLRPLLERGQPLAERTLFTMRRARASTLRGAISGDHKYIVTDFDPGLDAAQVRELYDLATDPREEINLAERQAELGEELDARLRAHEATSRKWNPAAQTYVPDPELLEKLKALGYGGEDEDRPQKSRKHGQKEDGAPEEAHDG